MNGVTRLDDHRENSLELVLDVAKISLRVPVFQLGVPGFRPPLQLLDADPYSWSRWRPQ